MKHLTPCQAIKKYCKTLCSNNDMVSWKECNKLIPNCPLLPYRFGKRGISESGKSKQKQAVISIDSMAESKLQEI